MGLPIRSQAFEKRLRTFTGKRDRIQAQRALNAQRQIAKRRDQELADLEQPDVLRRLRGHVDGLSAAEGHAEGWIVLAQLPELFELMEWQWRSEMLSYISTVPPPPPAPPRPP